MKREALLGLTLVLAALVLACGRAPAVTSGSKPRAQPPDGVVAFSASQRAFQQVQQMTLDRINTTASGVFKETTEVDCAAPYYHSLYIKDLSPAGIESNSSQLQGRARAHQEEEKLFVDGRSFSKFTGTWESPPPGTGDASPEWGPSRQSFDPTADCESFHQSKSVPFVPFDGILAMKKIAHQGQRTVAGTMCHEYRVTYSELVFSDTMKKVDTGSGFSTSYREQVPAPIESTICLGVQDFLPRSGTKGDIVFAFSYGNFEKLASP